MIREYLLAYYCFAIGLAGVLSGVLRDDNGCSGVVGGFRGASLIDGASWLNCSSLGTSGTVSIGL